jgi:hypothetical protein
MAARPVGPAEVKARWCDVRCPIPRALRRVPLAAPFRVPLQGAAAHVPVRYSRHRAAVPLPWRAT